MNIVKLLFLLVIPIFDPDFLESGLDGKSLDLTTSLACANVFIKGCVGTVALASNPTDFIGQSEKIEKYF